MQFTVCANFGSAHEGEAYQVRTYGTTTSLGSGTVGAGGIAVKSVDSNPGDLVVFWITDHVQAGPITLGNDLAVAQDGTINISQESAELVASLIDVGSTVTDQIVAAIRGGGTYLFDPIIKGDGGAPLPLALVTIKSGSSLLATGITNSAGHVSWGSINGFVSAYQTFTVEVAANGYSPIGPQTITLPADVNKQITLAYVPPSYGGSVPPKITARFDSTAIGAVAKTKFELRAVGTFTTPVQIGGKILTGFKFTGETPSTGILDASIYPSSVLIAAGVTSGDYDFLYLPQGAKDYITKRITVPDTNCTLASLL